MARRSSTSISTSGGSAGKNRTDVIDWSAFSWEAFATLATGLAAVAGAIVIGLKQVRITGRQTAILNQQAELEKKRLAHDLYDRRYKVFETTALMLHGMLGGIDPVQKKVQNDFLVALVESRFLFEPAVASALDEIWSKFVSKEYLEKKMQRDHDARGEYSIGDPDKELEINTWLDERIRTLPDLFHQLRLG